jgi:hypothetical protein
MARAAKETKGRFSAFRPAPGVPWRPADFSESRIIHENQTYDSIESCNWQRSCVIASMA